MDTREQCRRVRNNAPPVESHCGAAENAADNYTAPPKSMPAGRAPGERQLGVMVTPSTSLGCGFSPQVPGGGPSVQAPSPWVWRGSSALPSLGKEKGDQGTRCCRCCEARSTGWLLQPGLAEFWVPQGCLGQQSTAVFSLFSLSPRRNWSIFCLKSELRAFSPLVSQPSPPSSSCCQSSIRG